ncbi:MAG: hypothetical protein Nk1A_8610 [Endomicrobiia bacterium]|nr:MAG: hypothetical protein Nk1A_8610 [Endomicrobiia bacterium]
MGNTSNALVLAPRMYEDGDRSSVYVGIKGIFELDGAFGYKDAGDGFQVESDVAKVSTYKFDGIDDKNIKTWMTYLSPATFIPMYWASLNAVKLGGRGVAFFCTDSCSDDDQKFYTKSHLLRGDFMSFLVHTDDSERPVEITNTKWLMSSNRDGILGPIEKEGNRWAAQVIAELFKHIYVG